MEIDFKKYKTDFLPIIRWRQLLHDIPEHDQSLIFGCFGRQDELLVEVVGANGIG